MIREDFDHGLSDRQLAMLRESLSFYEDKIEAVGVFGSRATGTYRTNSDIDLILYGKLSSKDVGRLHTEFLDSALPFRVDVQAYDLLSHAPLKAHIDETMRCLFGVGDMRELGDVV